ncbi:MAG: glutamate-1-semialdehyde 2,1-aminomutase [Rhodoferax sp.]|nr:glutamate-1-semialdehyde 2,1-aminomutase [Rhodoferax sp.]MCB2004453.1 glutamate-1-semialdehyde 2,1-aminomutase [Rhodoferax sp.]MCB2027355.1 glutamate-1-semialdehyde 2,1-aminomutase [Rhodoferax sp.]MCP5263835.1 glutamate-1-semialdehyde 2,1-aminomutase [Rhodoferax sp.]MCW5628957.1 glutamate-1-semialdehyde 2,1-aminomutase [Rhodoferax sp.]
MADLNEDGITAEEWRARLHGVIPGGAHTYSRGDDQFPANAPPLLTHGKGAYVWGIDGKRYLDYGMALRAVTLGYADERVNAAAFAEMQKGVNLTRATLTELTAAQALVDLVPSVEMVKFAKNGSNVTTAAVKIARAYTGRRLVCVPRQQPFFSFDDWFIGTTTLKRGVPSAHVSNTLLFDYGDPASLQRLFDQHPGEIAAVMLEPATTMVPCASSCEQIAQWPNPPCSACPRNADNFLHKVQAICRDGGALFILDEMITGFRWHIAGAQVFFGVTPDITTFGKGMANGYSVAAVAGRREVMQVGSIDQPGMERTFLLSTTHGAEMPGLGAFLETVQIYRNEDVTGHLWAYGRKLKAGLQQVAGRHGLQQHFKLDGPDISLNYLTLDANGNASLALRTLFAQEMLARGVMMPWIAVSQAHGEAELQATLDAADGALGVFKQALADGVEKHLVGAAIKPVFRSHN